MLKKILFSITTHDKIRKTAKARILNRASAHNLIGKIQRRLAWPLRKDDTQKSRTIQLNLFAEGTFSAPDTA